MEIIGGFKFQRLKIARFLGFMRQCRAGIESILSNLFSLNIN
jgi:hypothetical protein